MFSTLSHSDSNVAPNERHLSQLIAYELDGALDMMARSVPSQRWVALAPFVQKRQEQHRDRERHHVRTTACVSHTAFIRSVRDGSRSRAVYRTDECAPTRRRGESPPREESSLNGHLRGVGGGSSARGGTIH